MVNPSSAGIRVSQQYKLLGCPTDNLSFEASNGKTVYGNDTCCPLFKFALILYFETKDSSFDDPDPDVWK